MHVKDSIGRVNFLRDAQKVKFLVILLNTWINGSKRGSFYDIFDFWHIKKNVDTTLE